MPQSRTRLLPVPHASIAQCQEEAIVELRAAGGAALPADWEARERQSWALAQPEAALESVSALAATAAGYVAKPLIRWFVGKVDDKLQESVRKYTATYHGTADFQLYVRSDHGPRLAHSCLRFTRLVERGGQERVAFDLLAQVRIVDREVLKIRPLRLFVGEVAAKTERDFLGIAVSLKADAVWREGEESRRLEKALQIDELLARRVEVGNGKLPLYGTYWNAKPELDAIHWASFASQPLPPWSRYDDVRYGGSHLALDVSVAEAGNVPWLLENAAKLFHAKRDDIVSLLEKAAEKALGDDAS